MRAKRWYLAHRWINVVVGVQLLLWALGGLIFATHDIDWVRGMEGHDEERVVRVDPKAAKVRAGGAANALNAEPPIERITLREMAGRPVWEVRHGGGRGIVAADSGEVLSPLPREEAERVALLDRVGEPTVIEAVLVESDPPVEYRGRPLPAWRVRLDDGEGTHIWVDALIGAVTARRNDAWRRFDLFWMLHTMDWEGRDDFNHPLLIGFAVLTLASILSGALLWGLRLRRRARRRVTDSAAA